MMISQMHSYGDVESATLSRLQESRYLTSRENQFALNYTR